MQCQTLVSLQWQEIDVVPLLDRIAAIELQIREAREGNTALLYLSERIEQQQKRVAEAEQGLQDARVTHESVLKQIQESTQELESLLQEDASRVPLTPHQITGLDERFDKQADVLSLKNLGKVATTVERVLNTEITDIDHAIRDCEKIIEARFTDFKRQWPMDAGDMDTSLSSAPDFLPSWFDWRRMVCRRMNTASSSCCKTRATRIWPHFPPTCVMNEKPSLNEWIW
ncbi:MAG: hypothetical protein MZV65_02760 [Chromatiales bacterium]|nr:hypothetical protein [Chromatiales bacterium]